MASGIFLLMENPSIHGSFKSSPILGNLQMGIEENLMGSKWANDEDMMWIQKENF